MLSTFERLVAFRYLRSRREEGFVSVVAGFSLAGIALGVATLIVVMAVMSGVKAELVTRIIGVKSHVIVYGASGRLYDYDDAAKEIGKIDGIAHISPLVEGQVMATHRGIVTGAMVNGMSPADLEHKPLIVTHIKEGSPAAFASGDGILLGYRMAEKLGLHAGDQLTLISPEGRQTVAGLMPRIKAYTVSGVFEAGIFEYDAGLILMPLEEAQVYFKHQDAAMPEELRLPEQALAAPKTSVTALEIMVRDVNDAPAIAEKIRGMLGPRVRVHDWQHTSASLFEAIQIQANVMVVILTLIILVASFNLVSSLIMLVQGKGRDVAILRTMGISRASIQRIFIAIGTMIGAMGTLVGVVLGLLIAANIAAIQKWIEELIGVPLFADQLYFFTTLPSEIHGSSVAGVAAMAILLSFLATIYPARRAAGLDPAEALRYE